MYIPFGKYRGLSIQQVDEIDPDYLFWLKGYLQQNINGYNNADLIREINFIFSLHTVQSDLKPDQQQAADEISDKLLADNEIRCHRLQGGAGYGKSYVVTEIAQRARDAGLSVTGIANSYVATQVLAQSLDPIRVEAKTIARAFQLSPNTEKYKDVYEITGNLEELKGSYYSAYQILKKGTLLIVDEYSMVSDKIVELVYQVMLTGEDNNSRLLVVGDKYQLPSPEQDTVCAFNQIHPVSELTIPKRFAPDSPLHIIEKNVRHHPYQLADILRANYNGKSIIRTNDIEGLYNRFLIDLEDNPDDSASILFFRRDAMVKANDYIRRSIYGPDADEIEVGEKLRVMRTTFYPIHYNSETRRWIYSRYYSGTFLNITDPHFSETIVDFEKIDKRFSPISLATWKVYTGDRIVPVIFSKNEHRAEPGTFGAEAFNKAISKLAELCKEHNTWKPYHWFRSHFVQVSYSYATTVHRSQGASVDRVYFSPQAVLQGGQTLAPKLAYVAATRARKQLTFC